MKLNASQYWAELQKIDITSKSVVSTLKQNTHLIALYAHMASSILSGILQTQKESIGAIVLQLGLQGTMTMLQAQGLMIEAEKMFGMHRYAKGFYYLFLASQSFVNYRSLVNAQAQAQLVKRMTAKIKTYKAMYK